MEVFLLVVHLLIALALVGIVLLQPSEGGALGVGQGPGGLSGMMQGRSAASALTRATVWLGIAFFVTSISLTLLAKASRTASPLAPTSGPAAPAGGPSSIPIPEGGLLGPAPDAATTAPAAPAPAQPAPAASETPATPAASAPAAPAAPATAAPAPSGTPSPQPAPAPAP